MPFKMPKRKIKQQVKFWDKEYSQKKDFALSDKPAGDLVTFFDWFDRQKDEFPPDRNSLIIDIGCGNARNLIFACQRYNLAGLGFDSSAKAIETAQGLIKKNNLSKLKIHLIKDSLFDIGFVNKDLEKDKRAEQVVSKFISENKDIKLDSKFYFIIDFMASHYLTSEIDRSLYFATLKEMLDDNGYIIIKSFLKDGDLHASKLLKKFGSQDNKNVYNHPRINAEEFIWSESEFFETIEKAGLVVEKFLRSHKHIIKGQVGKRRTFTAYLRQPR